MSSRAPKCRGHRGSCDALLCINSFSFWKALAGEMKSEGGFLAGWFLSLPIGVLRKCWLQPGNLGSATLWEKQERGEEDVACSHKGLLNSPGGCFGVFVRISHSLCSIEPPEFCAVPRMPIEEPRALRDPGVTVSPSSRTGGCKRLCDLCVPVGALAAASPGFSL